MHQMFLLEHIVIYRFMQIYVHLVEYILQFSTVKHLFW